MAEKATHDDADYRKGTSERRCDLCQHYRPPNSCTHVESPIAADMLCDWFDKKRAPIYKKK